MISEAAEILHSYGLSDVQVDRFGGDFPIRAFERHGIRAGVADRTTSDHYLAMLPVVNTGAVVLPDLPELLRELRGLERRRASSGRDHATHRPGTHDDAAASVAGPVALLAARRKPKAVLIFVGTHEGGLDAGRIYGDPAPEGYSMILTRNGYKRPQDLTTAEAARLRDKLRPPEVDELARKGRLR